MLIQANSNKWPKRFKLFELARLGRSPDGSMESSAAAARRMPDALQHCAPDSVASALLLDGGGRFEEVGNVAVTEDGEFVMWAGLTLPLGSAAGETASQHSKLQHALLKLIRGPSWDNRNYSSQVKADNCTFSLPYMHTEI